ncbi:MAG: ATP-binding protein [Xanthobacteraceae bacterium]|nr:ATP-binding protein [Xanthobacteraceae bacterium]
MHNGSHTDKQVETLAIAASGDDIRRACAWLAAALRQRDVPGPQVECLELALHEALANVLAHGGSAALAELICIRIEVRGQATTGEARVEVRDAGIPFDPTRTPKHTPARTLAEAQFGGLGLPLIRRCSDWMRYRREGDRNHFMFGTRWPKL